MKQALFIFFSVLCATGNETKKRKLDENTTNPDVQNNIVDLSGQLSNEATVFESNKDNEKVLDLSKNTRVLERKQLSPSKKLEEDEMKSSFRILRGQKFQILQPFEIPGRFYNTPFANKELCKEDHTKDENDEILDLSSKNETGGTNSIDDKLGGHQNAWTGYYEDEGRYSISNIDNMSDQNAGDQGMTVADRPPINENRRIEILSIDIIKPHEFMNRDRKDDLAQTRDSDSNTLSATIEINDQESEIIDVDAMNEGYIIDDETISDSEIIDVETISEGEAPSPSEQQRDAFLDSEIYILFRNAISFAARNRSEVKNMFIKICERIERTPSDMPEFQMLAKAYSTIANIKRARPILNAVAEIDEANSSEQIIQIQNRLSDYLASSDKPRSIRIDESQIESFRKVLIHILSVAKENIGLNPCSSAESLENFISGVKTLKGPFLDRKEPATSRSKDKKPPVYLFLLIYDFAIGVYNTLSPNKREIIFKYLEKECSKNSAFTPVNPSRARSQLYSLALELILDFSGGFCIVKGVDITPDILFSAIKPIVKCFALFYFLGETHLQHPNLSFASDGVQIAKTYIDDFIDSSSRKGSVYNMHLAHRFNRFFKNIDGLDADMVDLEIDKFVSKIMRMHNVTFNLILEKGEIFTSSDTIGK